jgi:DMSO/TMAO reductase YedYZ molybdopterin-dependent catalytic subunit
MQTTHETVGATNEPKAGPSAVAGTLGVAAALGASELFAGIFENIPSLILGIATFVIDTVPNPIKEWAIETFGTADKLVLAVGIVVVALGLGAVVGGRSLRTRAVVFGGFGLLAALASARTEQASALPALLNGAASAATGLAATWWLRRPRIEADPSRRAFLGKAGAVAAFAVVAAAGGRYLFERTRVMLARRDEVVLPTAVETVQPVATVHDLAVEGITPIVVPNEDFYRIDTAPLSVPQIDISTWSLNLKGLVDREVTLTYADILDMPMVERYITISCVSNDIGGGLVGNAKWLGVPLRDIIDMAGVGDGAEQLVGRSVDGFTVGFPVEAVYDGREALLAIGMNGEPLPFEHGFPARLVVSGLYGYVSATKWLQDIELTTWDGFDAYWIPRGWAKEAPVKTQSRIDTPRGTVAAGPRSIAGVAWAPGRGISKVEVRIDEAQWLEAELSEPLSADAWVQWNLPWDPAVGQHTIEVRATDGTGETQTSEITPVAPDGASGHHTVRVSIA